MSAGYWSLLIGIITIPSMGAGVVLMYLGFHDIRGKDHFGWLVAFVGWTTFWMAVLYSAGFIGSNLT